MGSTFRYSIVHVPHNEAGVQRYLKDFKTLRLYSLHYAPEAFGSTYSREIAFDDKVWHDRLSNPMANTFLAVEGASNLIGTMVIVGPLAIGTLEMPPIPQSVHGGWNGANPLHFRLNGIFTMPEARGRGVSKALIKTSIQYVMDEAQTRNKDVVFSIIVDQDNVSARAAYESTGFIEAERLEPSDNTSSHSVVILEYRPSLVSAETEGV